jgi:hypothetical protein
MLAAAGLLSCHSPRAPEGSSANGEGGTADATPTATPSYSCPDGDTPCIPVGLDAYRAWDRLPYVRIGARTYMRSTYDRAGGNEAADASHYLREVEPGRDVALDVAGSGVLSFFRANHWHGSPWHFVIDGADNVVADSATAAPDSPPPASTFLPAASFPAPLALTYATTQGADVSWVPMGFTRSLAVAYERTHYGTGYFVYSLFDPGADVSQPVAAWDGAAPAQDVLALLAAAGSDIAPAGDGVTAKAGVIDVPAGSAVTVVDLAGPATVRVLRLLVPLAAQRAIEGARLRVTWDGRALPSVDAPVPLFFGAGTLFNRAGAEHLVKALPAVVRFAPGAAAGEGTIELSMYLPMPFQKSAHVEIEGGPSAAPGVGWQVRTVPFAGAPNAAGYFHASYVDHGTPIAGQDLVLLDTTRVEGGGDWCGAFVGTSAIFSDAANLGTLEGDPRFFFDDSQTPQGQGTGTEEWGAGGDYWMGGQTTTLPLAGHPVGAPSAQAALGPEDLVESTYRFLVADSFPFGKNARIQLEHGGADDSTEHYRSVAYWYGLPSACLVQTDALHVGDPADEAAHGYASPQASAVDTLTSRYEWGVDHVGATEVYPATTDTGRHTTGRSEFTIALREDNLGALLRRKLDYGFADQRATVSIADASAGGAADGSDASYGAFVPAGTWFLAGSNQCAYANAATETGVVAPSIETSNRRWRDDEFLVPRALTRGKSRVRVRIDYEAAQPAVPVAPGAPAGPRAWSEYRYTAYSWVMPAAPP